MKTTPAKAMSHEREATDWLTDEAAAQRLVDLSAELADTDARIEGMKRALATLQEQRASTVALRDGVKDSLANRETFTPGSCIKVNGGQVRHVPEYSRLDKDGSTRVILPSLRVDLARSFMLPFGKIAAPPISGVVSVDAPPETKPSAAQSA